MSLEKARSMEVGLQLIVTQPQPAKVKKMPLRKRIKLIVTNITVEPIMICYVLPNVMAYLATQNLSLEKACRVNLRFSEELCDALYTRNESYPGYKESEQAVQKLAANIAVFKNVIQSILPSLLLLFLGSWSDRHKKRKPCIINPIIGDITMCVGLLICTYFFYQLPVEVNSLAEALPPAVTGGWFAISMGIFTYVSEITDEDTRTTRIGAVNTLMNVSVCVGIALSGVFYEYLGFYGVYSLSLAMDLIALVYAIYFLKDICVIQRENGTSDSEDSEGKKNFFLDLFDVKHVLETFRFAFRKDDSNKRFRICIIMILLMVIVGPMYGEMNVSYYLVRYKYGWDSIDYSIFSTFQFVTYTLGTIFSLSFFTNYLKVDDAILGIISNCSKILGALIYAFAPTSLFIYVGAVAEMLNGTSFVALRSIASKLVPSSELGKVNSLFGVCESIVPLVYGPLYSKVYALTIDFFPGAYFLVGGILTAPAIIIFFWLYLEHKKDKLRANEQKGQEEELLDIGNKTKSESKTKEQREQKELLDMEKSN